MKSPHKSPKRYGRRSYTRSAKTQILNRQRLPLDVVLDTSEKISPLDIGGVNSSAKIRGSLVESISPASPMPPSKIKSKKMINPDNENEESSASTSKACSRNKSNATSRNYKFLTDPLFEGSKTSGSNKKSAGASASTAKTKNKKYKKAFTPKRRDASGGLGELTLKVPVPPPDNITVRTKAKHDQVWEDGMSALTAGTKKKRVLRDLGNQRRENEEDDAPLKKPMGEYRTKSARKKRKSVEDTSTSKKQRTSKEKVNPCVIFTVPEFEAGRRGEDKYQERKYLGLIEGVGGGIEEEDNKDGLPHRGRLMELPGEIMPGAWKAQVVHDTTNDTPYQRISLRHHSAMDSSLETHLHNEDQVSVSVINPTKNRLKSFIDQGIFADDEIYDDEDGEEKILNSAYIGCISLVWFDGFTSASDAVNMANEVSEGLLKLSVPPSEDGGADELVKLVRKDRSNDADGCVGGVLFRTKLAFENEYSVLISYNGFEIDAVDVVFKRINIHSNINGESLSNIPHRGLTPSLLSHYLDCVGSSVDDLMERFIDGDANSRIDASFNPNATKAKDDVRVNQKETERKILNDSASNDNDSYEDFGGGADNLDADIENNDSIPFISTQSEVAAIEKSKLAELHGAGIEESPVKKPRASVQQKSTSPALEAVKERAHTTVHSQKDITFLVEKALEDTPTNGPSERILSEALLGVNDEDVQTSNSAAPSIQSTSKTLDSSTRALESMEQVRSEHKANEEKRCAENTQSPEVSVEAVPLMYNKPPENTMPGVKSVSTKTSSAKSATEKSIADETSVGGPITRAKETTKFEKDASLIVESLVDAHRKANETQKNNKRPSITIKTKSSSAPSKLNLHTPANISRPKQNSVFPKTSRKLISRNLFDATSKLKAKKRLSYPTSVKHSIKKKEYVMDLFGENESMFGFPTIKTPAARRKKSSGSRMGESIIGKSSKGKKIKSTMHSANMTTRSARSNLGASTKSKGQTSFVKTTTKFSAGAGSRESTSHQLVSSSNSCMTSLPINKSPVVTPGGRNVALIEKARMFDAMPLFEDPISAAVNATVDEADLLQDDDEFHDAASVSFESPCDEHPVLPAIGSLKVGYLSPQRFHDVYYGQGVQSPGPCFVPPPNTMPMTSPERFGSFHDYYFGQGYFLGCDVVSTPRDQPLHDVYFGQYTHCEELSLTELPSLPDSLQAQHDIYFGQDEIIDFGLVRGSSGLRVGLRKPRLRNQRNLYFVFILIWSLFSGAMQPFNTRYQKPSSFATDMFTSGLSDVTGEADELTIIEQVAEGWFSGWF